MKSASFVISVVLLTLSAAASVTRIGPTTVAESLQARASSPPPLRIAEALAENPVMTVSASAPRRRSGR